MLNTTDLESVRTALQSIADDNYPGHRGGEFHIRTPLGPVIIGVAGFVRPAPPRVLTYAPEPQTLSEGEQEIVQVLSEAAGEVLKGEEIAEKIGCEYTGTFRGVLAAMVRRGIVKRATGRPGYHITAA